MKVFQVEQRGYVWQVPAHYIAVDRAKYYAENDPDTTYDSEYEYTMGSDFELSDWFLNNMNWEDISEHSKLVQVPDTPTEPDFGEDMTTDILEVEDV